MKGFNLIFQWAMEVLTVSGRQSLRLFIGMTWKRNKQTSLILFPFCYMDANSFYEQKYTAPQALEEMRHYYQSVKSVNGTFIMIWHNSFLGTDELYSGWREVYEQFIKEVA